MRRLPALGTVVLFLGTFGLAVQASADPINIDSGVYVRSSSKPGSLTFMGNGFAYGGSDRDTDKPEIHPVGGGNYTLSRSFSDNFPLSSGSIHGVGFNNLWLDGHFKVTSPGFTPSKSGNAVPFQFTANVTGYGYTSAPGREEKLFTQQLQGTGLVQVSYAQQSGGLLLPSAITYNFGGASTFGGASSVVTPEPASMLLFGTGLGLAALRARLRRRKR